MSSLRRTQFFVVCAFFVVLSCKNFALATSTSTSYQLEDESINLGGGYVTSTSFSADFEIGDLLIGRNPTVIPPVVPPPGGPPAPPGPPPGPPPPVDLTPPVISGVAVVDLLNTSARIIWNTDESATSFVDYGLTDLYGLSASGTPSVTAHSVNLLGLTPRTTYHYRVRSADGAGNESFSGDFVFTTRMSDDVTPPELFDIRVVDITGTSAAIIWTTNESANSVVNYGTTDGYGLNNSDATLVLSHRIELGGLTPGVTYHFRVLSTDENGNETVSADYIFTTITDTTAPIISDINVLVTDSNATVTWNTDEPSDTGIEWGRTPAYELGNSLTPEAATAHTTVLGGLIGNTLYYFRVNSADAGGNRSFGPARTFRTLPDAVSPANVSDFVTVPSPTSVDLTWQNPPDPDFAGVVIQRSGISFPTDPADGARIYDGQGQSVTDTSLSPSTIQFYTIFVYDTSGNFSSGALGSTTTLPPLLPPLPTPEPLPTPAPELPPVPVPPVTVPSAQRMTVGDIQIWLADRTLLILPESIRVRTFVGTKVGVTIRPERMPRAASGVILNLGSGSYLLRFDPDRRTWDTDVVAPGTPGTFPGAVIVTYPDGATDVISFDLTVDPYGYVYEVSEGIERRVPEATVTLFVFEDGVWREWNAARYAQLNPQVVPADGHYGFLSPPGTYYLRFQKDGYRPKETIRSDMESVVISQNIEILRYPPSPLEVIEPGLPVLENAARVADAISQQAVFAAKVAVEGATKIVDNPAVEEAAETVVAPAVVALAIVNAAAAIPALSLWSYLQYLLTQPFLLFQRRRRREWGVVYNALTRLPVDLAIVRLLDAAGGRVLQSQVTDKAGRYAFVVGGGSYLIEVSKQGFVFPTAYLKNKTEDFDFLDLYHGEPVTVSEHGVTVTPNIPLDPIEKMETPRSLIRRHLFRLTQNVLGGLGIAVSAVVVVISPTILNLSFLGLQILLYLLFRRLAYVRRPKGWGVIYDEKTKDPLRFAIARIFETEYNKLLETRVTDASGRYVFLVGRNRYRVTFERAGYRKKELPEIDATGEKKKVIGVNIGLESASAPSPQPSPSRGEGEGEGANGDPDSDKK